MYSITQKEDRELLMEISETILVLVKVGNVQALDLAETMGNWYVELTEKIKHHDYTKDDKIRTRVDNVINRMLQGIK